MRLIYLKECRRYTVASLQACIRLQLGTPQPDSTSKIEDESIKRLKESINGEFIRRLKDSINKECGKTIVRGKGDVIVFHYVGLYDYIDAETNLTFFFVPKFLDVRDSDETDDAEKDEVGNNWAADDFTSWKTCYEKFEKHGRDVLLRALDRYSKEDSKIADEYEDSDQRRESILELAVRMLRDYLENGLYIVQRRELERNGQGEIDWNTTIDTFQPMIKNGRPYYMEVLTEQAYSDEDHYITRLHKCLVTTWGRKLEELGISSVLRVNVPMLSEEDLDLLGDKDYKIAQINRELNVQFVTKKRESLVLMRNLIERMSESKSINEESLAFGMTGFEQLWEAACAKVLGSELEKNIIDCHMSWKGGGTFREYMPKPIWQNLSDDKTSTDDERLGSVKSGWRLDFIRTWPKDGNVKKLVILDAKYYCVRWGKDKARKDKILGQPGVGDIAKQIFYQMAFHDLLKENEDRDVSILNAFIFPEIEKNEKDTKGNKNTEICLGEVVELKFTKSISAEAFRDYPISAFRLPAMKLLEAYANYQVKDKWFNEMVEKMTNSQNQETSMIEITFGMALDGARWTEKGASIGKMTCGPLGLLKFLETRLGLGGVEVPQAERIGAYLEKVRAVYGMMPDAWGAESFKKDYWTTTKRLLAWRDELVDAGWDGKQGGSDRLDVLAKIEATGDLTPAGLPDRVKRAVQACTKEALSGVTMTLVDDLDKYPHHWRMFFKKLGIASQWKIPERPEPKVDGKVLVDEVVAANEIQLAGLFVKDLKARLEGQKRVALIAEGDTGILDESLHRAGLPSIGQSQSSAERAAIQILPLWIKYMWKPFDPMTLLAILKSEVSPFIPGRKENDTFKPVGLRIVKALRESPGIGGEAWNAAWEEIGPDFAEYRKVLEAPRFDPEGDGVPYEEFARRIDWLVAKLGPKAADDFKFLDERAKGMLKGTIQSAKLLRRLAKSLEKIDRVALQRLLETIVATGSKMPGARHEVAPWRVYAHPGQITADVDCVLWWNFCDSGHGTGTYWTNEERLALGADVEFDAENSLARESDGWYNAFVRAKEEFKLYHPMTAFGEACGDHSFRADLIHHKYIEDKEPVVRECDSEAPVEIENSDGEPEETNVAKVPPSKDLKPGSVSATQLSSLLSCPFKWYLEKHLNLREQDALALPTGPRMVGTLAHKVVEMIITHHKGVNPTEAGVLAERYFDERVSQMAAELEAPDRTVELDYYRSTLKESVETLWREVEKRGLKFVAAEKKLDKEGAFHGLDFTGSADIVLEDGAGRPYVIDLKWSAGKHYIEAAENGRSVQLATYSWAIDPANMDVKSAYYLFPKKKFYENPQDDREVWRKIQTDYARTVAEMQRGELHRGYEKDETELGLKPPCNFCSFKALCGKERE